MKQENKAYCKMCKVNIKKFDDFLECKCKHRFIANLEEFGIPVDWQGKSEINKICNLKVTTVDFKI